MKIISFGDIHEDISNLIKIKDSLETANLIIISGDITNCHGIPQAKKVIEGIRKYNNNILALYGNMDLSEVDGYLTKENINLHGNGYLFDDIGIFGCGGSSPTPFNTPSEISEEDINTFLKSGYLKVKDAKCKIMVCHTPPKDTTVDVVRGGVHVGSNAVRDFILEYKPDVCITGHIHESRGKDKIGNTLILNAGMFRDGWYIEVVVDKGGISAALKSVV